MTMINSVMGFPMNAK